MLSKLQTSQYPEPDSHVSNKIKAVLDLPNYDTKNQLIDATGVN